MTLAYTIANLWAAAFINAAVFHAFANSLKLDFSSLKCFSEDNLKHTQ
jgi:hypothetical protein